MEMTLNNGFCEMSQDECINIDGGVCGIDDGLLLTAFWLQWQLARQ